MSSIIRSTFFYGEIYKDTMEKNQIVFVRLLKTKAKEDGIPTKHWHQSLVKAPYVESPPNFSTKDWSRVPRWNPHQTLASKFGEKILHEILTKLQHQSLVSGSLTWKSRQALMLKFGYGCN